MRLVYDPRDVTYARTSRSRHIEWLIAAGATPLSARAADDEQFLFAGARPIEDYCRLVANHPNVVDRPEDRGPLLQLNTVLDAIAAASVVVPTPRTWRLELDAPPPDDLTFPLFIRTVRTSWKLGGGQISRVRNRRQLADECEALRRAFGWDATILAREWLDLAPAGVGTYGPIPQEIRVWTVRGQPVSWSFHHGGLIANPVGIPPAEADLRLLYGMATQVAAAFTSLSVVADFARTKAGAWTFIEAGPGSCAGTSDATAYAALLYSLQKQPVNQMHPERRGFWVYMLPRPIRISLAFR